MNEESMTYEGFTIAARIEPAEDTACWSAVMTISRHEGSDKESWIFSAGDTYESREEAARRCFDFAREVIDREMQGCAID